MNLILVSMEFKKLLKFNIVKPLLIIPLMKESWPTLLCALECLMPLIVSLTVTADGVHLHPNVSPVLNLVLVNPTPVLQDSLITLMLIITEDSEN